MTTVQLRRYEVIPGKMEELVEWWKGVVEIREQYGFRVLFAFVDRATYQFVWAVAHEGDDGEFDEAERVYLESPERAKAFAGQPKRLNEMHVTKVEVVHSEFV